MEDELETYNAFGIVTVHKGDLQASITAVSGSRSVSRTIKEPCENLDDSDDVAVMTFGVFIPKSGKAKVTIHELGKGSFSLYKLKQVKKIMEKIVQMEIKALGFDDKKSFIDSIIH